jgi:hypothetical protein
MMKAAKELTMRSKTTVSETAKMHRTSIRPVSFMDERNIAPAYASIAFSFQ